MSRIMQGNLAVKDVHAGEEVVGVKQRKVKRKAIIPAKEKLLYLFTIIFCVFVAGSVIFKYAQIYEINTKIHELEAELQLLHKENESLKLEVRKLLEPKRLLEEGRKLGFVPSEEEVVSLISKVHMESEEKSSIAIQQ